MQHKLIAFVLILFFPLTAGGCLRSSQLVPSSQTQQDVISDRENISIQIGDASLTVEAVTTPASLTQGLSGRDSIGSDGMLFVMPNRDVAHFWMKDMKFALDFVWIDSNKVVGIIEDVPAPKLESSAALPSYSSTVPVTHVLELPAGKVQEYEIVEGDTVIIGN